MTSVRLQRNSWSLRLLAVVATLLWLVAQFWCFQHCASSRMVQGAHGCCVKRGLKPGTSSQPTEREGTMLCGTLKSARMEATTSLSLPPETLLLNDGPVVWLIPVETRVDLDLSTLLRQVPRADFVFLPEVSLGAALRGLAPPSLG